MLTKEELEKYKEYLIKEISAFLKECPMCKNKFKDFLEKRNICVNCEREQKLNDLGI
jgi:protein-arginine kinase activator protein McsA